MIQDDQIERVVKNTVWFDVVESAPKDMSILNYK